LTIITTQTIGDVVIA